MFFVKFLAENAANNGEHAYRTSTEHVQRMTTSGEIEVKPCALLALGANLSQGGKPPQETLRDAVALLAERTGQTLKVSRFYRTPAFPPGSGPDFVNAAAALRWTGPPEALLALLHEVEAVLGRTRRTRWEARIMDIDLIALGAQVMPDADTQRHWENLSLDQAATQAPDRLILPHPRMAERSFVLIPLADIAPDWRHPLTGLTVAEMRAARPHAEQAEVVALDTA